MVIEVNGRRVSGVNGAGLGADCSLPCVHCPSLSVGFLARIQKRSYRCRCARRGRNLPYFSSSYASAIEFEGSPCNQPRTLTHSRPYSGSSAVAVFSNQTVMLELYACFEVYMLSGIGPKLCSSTGSTVVVVVVVVIVHSSSSSIR